MANEQNLRPPTANEARERGKKGGQASAEARARRKTFKELFEIALSVKSEDGLTEQEKIVLRAIEVAKATGNYKDIEATIGEKPKDSLSFESENLNEIKIKFVDKSKPKTKEQDPKIIGEYTPPSNVEG